MGALEKTRQELDTTKLHLSSTQQSLHERDRHLNSLRQDRRKQLQEILEMKLVATFTVKWHLIPFLFEISPFFLNRDELSCRNKRRPFCFGSEFSLSSCGGGLLLLCNCFSVMVRVWSTSASGCVLITCVSYICTKTLTKHQTGRKQRAWQLLALTAVKLAFE